MKKTLLMLVAFMATMTAFAQEEPEGWEKSFTPVTDAKKLAGVNTAVASDGSVYVSSTYDQAFTFAEKSVTDPEGLLSSCVLKYDKDGNELWSVSFVGACTINAMAADSDGTLYVVGRSQDFSVTCTGTDGQSKIIEAPTKEVWGDIVVAAYPAFIAKISKEGVFEAIKTITPSTDEIIANATGEVWGEIMNLYPSWNTPMILPNNIQIDGDKVYVSALYMGDVKELNWEGGYIFSEDMGMYDDLYSAGVFSLEKSNLSDPANVAFVGDIPDTERTDGATSLLYEVDDLNFYAENGISYVFFVGKGKLRIVSPAGTEEFTDWSYNSALDGIEHPLVCATITSSLTTKVFRVNPHENESLHLYKILTGEIIDGNIILGGNFYGNFWFKEDLTTNQTTSFVASIKLSDSSVQWATPNTVASEATCMIVTGEEIKASTDAATYTIKTATGEVKTDMTMNKSFADADVYNDEYVSTVTTDGASVVVFSPKMSPSGIEAIKAAAAKGEMKIFNLNGQRVAKPQKGLYIINGTKVAIK